ncbi:NIPSNAP family protein [Oceanobacillus sojae]|uniref:NIPSNAP family protein n=1 Tax=Oceanobacillus sojae TaxID=582851 RepID=UPI0021A7BF8B|nr:NIPSNAP family protein [Oceanobacillus sojae]MCT1902426.1 NIPSNAP family protein [Oceanobacillus sojae]
MFYRRKYYLVKSGFTEILNEHFRETNPPNQLKHGSRLAGRWKKENKDNTTEIFAIWEYDSYDEYLRIKTAIRADMEHVKRVQAWYDKYGGKDYVLGNYILEVRHEMLQSTLD